jgi:hypothetical protein
MKIMEILAPLRVRRRFKNPKMQEQYEFALTHHELMMMGGNGGRTAYKRGYQWPERDFGYRGTAAAPQWRAGVDNRRTHDTSQIEADRKM